MRTGELYQRYYGIFIAEVVDVMDPDKLGRIRVKSDQFTDTVDAPTWLSVVRPGAGNGLGVFFTPKVGDQVAVGYLVGDVREPMAFGYVHSMQNAPDPSLTSPTKHAIVTTIGNVVFDEQAASITVTLLGPPPAVMTMDSNGITLDVNSGAMTESKVTIDPQNGIKLDFSPGGAQEASVTIDSSGITATSQLGTITLDAMTINVGGNSTMTANVGSATTTTIAVGATPAASVTVAGQPAVLELFLDAIFATHFHPTALGPSGPPIPLPPVPGEMSQPG
jgi:Type VI secretion system/phage-baseplate injector OB domain